MNLASPILNSDQHSTLIQIPVSDFKPGDYLVNLGNILEIEEREDNYIIIIDRMDEKQVLKFKKTMMLYVKI